jgi:hypothetical protein
MPLNFSGRCPSSTGREKIVSYIMVYIEKRVVIENCRIACIGYKQTKNVDDGALI